MISYNSFLKSEIFQVILIVVFSFGLYINTLWNDYVYDDINVISENVLVLKGIEGIPGILTHAYRYGYKGRNVGLYRPVSLLSFAIEVELFGLNPMVNHFINVLIYAFSCGLFLIVLRMLLRNHQKIIPFIIALIFLAHPVHTEVVANIKSRDELFSFLFILLTIYYLILSIDKNSRSLLWKASFFYLLTLLSKETAFTFLLLIPLILFFFRDLNIKSIVLKSVPFFAVCGLYLFMVFSNIDRLEGGDSTLVLANSLVAAKTFTERWATTVLTLGKYVWILIFPHPLICDYSYNQIPITNWGNWRVILSLLTYLTMIGIAFWKFQSKQLISFGILVFIITISIFSNIFFIINWTMGERFLFFPSIGFSICAALFIVKIASLKQFRKEYSMFNPKIIVLLLLPLLILYSIKTVSRNFEWRTNTILFEADLKKGPNNARLYLNLAKEYLRDAVVRKDDDPKKRELCLAGLDLLKRSIDIYPYYSPSWLDRGSAYGLLGQNETAIKCYEKALKYDPLNHDIFYNMGITYKEMKDYSNAVYYLNKAKESATQQSKLAKVLIQLADIYSLTGNHIEAIKMGTAAANSYNHEKVLNRLAVFYFRYGDALIKIAAKELDGDKKKEQLISAYKSFESGIKYSPNSHVLYNALGNASFLLGDYERAILNFNLTANLNSSYVEPYFNLGIVYAQKGEFEKSNKFYLKVLNINPKYTRARYNIALNLLSLKQFDLAINYLKPLIKLKPEIPDLYNDVSEAYRGLRQVDSADHYLSKYKEISVNIKDTKKSNR